MRKPSIKYGTLLLYKDNAQIASKFGKIFPIFFEFVVFSLKIVPSRRFFADAAVIFRKTVKIVRSI